MCKNEKKGIVVAFKRKVQMVRSKKITSKIFLNYHKKAKN